MMARTDEGEFIERLQSGDRSAVSEQLAMHRPRLKRMVRLRMHGQLSRRIDASDVIQEAYLDAARRLEEYINNPAIPFFIWLRLLTIQKLAELHRHHLGTKARDASREISLYGGSMPAVESKMLAAKLIDRVSSPSTRAMRAEMKQCLQNALDELNPVDREIIALRHFEKLTNTEVAQVIEVTPAAANSRYFRAMQRLKKLLAQYSEFGEGLS